MPWDVQCPHSEPKHPEDGRHVGSERRGGEECYLKNAKDGKEDPGSTAEENGQGFDSDFFIVRAILYEWLRAPPTSTLRCFCPSAHLGRIKHVKVDHPAHRGTKKWKRLIQITKIVGDRSPAGKNGTPDDGTKDHLWERHQALHEGINHTQSPDGREGDEAHLAKGQVGDADRDGNPCEKSHHRFGEGDDPTRERANFATLYICIKISITDVTTHAG